MPKSPRTLLDDPVRRTAVFGVVLATEYLAIRASWHTEGEIFEGVLLLVVMPICAACAAFTAWRPRQGAAVLTLLWLLVVPPVAFQLVQLARARLEAQAISEYVRRVEATTGALPANLDGYEFRDPWIREGIFGYQREVGDRFTVFYGPPGYEDVAHSYDRETGWGYYPD
jgi:hypothetical protein